MTLVYILKLGLQIRHTNVRAQKIDGSILKMFEIVLANFQVKNKLGKARFLQKMFLLTNISMKVILRISFLILNNANI